MTKQDQTVLQIAVKEKIITQEQAKNALELQKNYEQQGKALPLFQILIKKGFITAEQWNGIQNKIQPEKQNFPLEPSPSQIPSSDALPISQTNPESQAAFMTQIDQENPLLPVIQDKRSGDMTLVDNMHDTLTQNPKDAIATEKTVDFSLSKDFFDVYAQSEENTRLQAPEEFTKEQTLALTNESEEPVNLEESVGSKEEPLERTAITDESQRQQSDNDNLPPSSHQDGHVGMSFFVTPDQDISASENATTKAHIMPIAEQPKTLSQKKEQTQKSQISPEKEASTLLQKNEPSQEKEETISQRKIEDAIQVYQDTQKRKKTPEKFGRYDIIRELGHGNMGRVFLVQDTQLGRKVALKVLLSGAMADQTAIMRFLREAQSTAKLNHPNIIKIYDIGKEGENHFFTMDYIQGKALNDLIKQNKRVSPRKSAEIVSKVCDALHHAHENSIIHRDIKPSNIMLTEDNEPKLMDFGLARSVGERSKASLTGSIIGTPAYMPPEQALGKIREIDARSDIYSIGATLYELITGQIPFPGTDPMSILMKIAHGKLTPPSLIHPGIPQDLENICMKAMEKKKEDRYQTALQMSQDLQHFLEGEAVSVTNRKFSWKNWLAEHKMVASASCIILTILLVSATILWIQKSKLEMQRNELREANATLETQKSELKKANGELKSTYSRLQEETAAKEDALSKKDQALKKAKEAENLAIKQWKESQSYLKLALWATPLDKGEIPIEIDSEEKLIKEFREILEHVKQSDDKKWKSDFYFKWGKAYIALGQKKSKNIESRNNYLLKGIDQIRNAIKLYPKNYDACLEGSQVAFLFYDHVQIKEITAEFLGHITLEEDNLYSHFRKAVEYRHQIENDKEQTPSKRSKEELSREALQILDKIIVQRPDFAGAYLEQGLIYYRLRKYTDAQKSFERALYIYPQLSMIRVSLAIVYFQIGKLYYQEDRSKSLSFFQQALNLYQYVEANDSSFQMTYLSRSRLFAHWAELENEEKYFQEALEDLEKAFRLGNIDGYNKKKADIWEERAKLYSKTGKYKEAIADYKSICNLYKESPKILFYGLQIQTLQKKLDAKKD